MRVITGSARGRRLREPEGFEIRPTTDRVKEGVFSAVQFEIEGRRILDLFAGTGQLGIECLSRGAAFAVFVDQNPAAVETVRHNLTVTGLADRARVVTDDAFAYLQRTRERFDLIFLDPPYRTELLEKAVQSITAFDILTPRGIMLMEHPAQTDPPRVFSPYVLRRTYRYGKIAVTLCRREADGIPSAQEHNPVQNGVNTAQKHNTVQQHNNTVQNCVNAVQDGAEAAQKHNTVQDGAGVARDGVKNGGNIL